MDRKVRPAQHHPSPQPCPPVSPPGVVGCSSWRPGPQQLHSAPHCSPSHTAPTWADIARGGNLSSSHYEAPATPTADAIALYKPFVSMGLQARFSIRSSAGYVEPSAMRHHSTQRRQRNHSKPATRVASAQTEPFVNTPPPHLHRRASTTLLAQATSPTAQLPAKKTRKRRCKVELLTGSDDDFNLSLCITPPTLQATTSSRSPCSPMLTPSPQHPLPQQSWLSPATLPLESTAFTPPHTAPSALGPPPLSPDNLAPDLQPLAPYLQPPTSDPQSSAPDLHPPAPDPQSSTPDIHTAFCSQQ
jgi:hypothetical protein